ncbi:MAG: sigma-70 family RNA polymerase sigma factor [Bacteroidota bacterium]|nr:sigma-70 family RNA polymerase sigma factor [Bacteroidota bacterium]MDP4205602.1 sigma-70 family RNA polymerase sigma factor [Bacteroidota bacterium]
MTQVQFNNSLLSLKDRLMYYALSLTSDPDKANDLVQETFLKALYYRDKFTQNTNFSAWVHTIMKNTFINDYRKKVKARNTFYGSNNELHLKFAKSKLYPSPDSFFSSKEIVKEIRNLTDEYRIPFRMFLDGYKYKEIAEQLNLPLGTVKSRIFFTRKKLEKSLREFTED